MKWEHNEEFWLFGNLLDFEVQTHQEPSACVGKELSKLEIQSVSVYQNISVLFFKEIREDKKGLSVWSLHALYRNCVTGFTLEINQEKVLLTRAIYSLIFSSHPSSDLYTLQVDFAKITMQ